MSPFLSHRSRCATVDPTLPPAPGLVASASQSMPMQSPSECDPAYMYQSMYRPAPHPPLSTAPMHAPVGSAFCPFPPQSSHDPIGEFYKHIFNLVIRF